MNWTSALVVMVLATPLAAQQAEQPDTMHHPMMGAGRGMMMDDPMMERMGPSLMRMMLYTPQHLLARKDASTLAIIGSGVQARSHLQALRLVRQFRDVRVWSPRHADRFADGGFVVNH